MENSVKTKSVLQRRIAILALGTMSMVSLAISPSYAAIAQAFKASNTMVQMLTSIANLAALIAGLMVGRLVSGSMSRKKIVVTAVALICIGGLLPLAIHGSMGILIVFSAIIGFGQGMVTNMVQILITEELPEKNRQSAMGQNTTFTNIGAMVLITLGGVLAAKSWINNYWVFLIPVLVLIIVMICLPSQNIYANQAKDDADVDANVDNGKIELNKYSWAITFLGFLSMLLYNVFSNNISMFVVSHKLGGSAQAGILSMIGLLGGLLAGLIVGKLAKILPKYTISISFLLMALSYLIIGWSNSMSLVIVGSFLSGAALSVCMAQYPFLISISIKPSS
ncbi:MFS transporter [Secundilactobacillus similis]|nr:MFS transporter [Secundilactobacillus similis]